jgi:hypothetical protein
MCLGIQQWLGTGRGRRAGEHPFPVERATFLFEDVNYFVPHFNFAAITASQGVPTFLYQFEYEGIGKAYAHPPNR